jgi:Flp pilus assembly protein TadG/uncharacterized protein YegL
VAIAFPVLLGLAGCTIDLGNWYLQINRAQNAADGAALAGAVYLPDDPDLAVQTAKDLLVQNHVPPDLVQTADIHPLDTDPTKLYVAVQAKVRNVFLPLLGVDTTSMFSRHSLAVSESCKASGTDYSIVLDFSGSMDHNDPGDSRLLGAASVVDSMGPKDQVAIIGFSGSAVIAAPLSTDKTLLKNAIHDPGDTGNGTNITSGLQSGIDALQPALNDGRNHVIIFLTDGNNTVGAYDSSLEGVAAQDKIVVYTIGLSGEADANLLTGLANATGGSFTQVDNASTLPQVFEDVSMAASCGKQASGALQGNVRLVAF